MIPYLGDFVEDESVYIPFNTFTSDDPSASCTITNLANADVKVHKDGGTTEIATDGAAVFINFDGVTGNHLIKIDTSVHADYSVGSDYLVRIEGTTVDNATINAWVGCFSIQNRYMRGTDSAALASVCTEARLAELDAANLPTDIAAVATPAQVATALTNIKLDHLIAIAAAEDEVADNSIIARLAAADGDWSSYNDILHSLENQYDNIATLVSGMSTVTGKLPANKFMGSSDGADDDGTLNLIKTATDNLPGDPASETNVNANETKIDALPTAAAIKTAMETDGSMLEHLHEMTEDDGGVRRLTANALEEGPGGGTGLNAQETRDAMKLAPTAGDPAAGSVDEHLDDLPTAAAIKTAMETDGGMLEHLHEMTEDDGGVRRLTENALEQAPSGTGGDATAANQNTIIGYIDTEIASIKAKTDLLNFTGSDIKATLDGEAVKLAADGLSGLTITEPSGDPDGWSFEQKLLWLIMRFLNKHTSDNFNGIRVHKADSSISTTQAVTEAGGVKTVGKAT